MSVVQDQRPGPDGAAWTALRGKSGAPVTLTSTEAAAAAHLSGATVAYIARQGLVDAVKVDSKWLVDGDSVAAYLERRAQQHNRPERRRLPSGPLLRQVELAGGAAAVGALPGTSSQRYLDHAKQDGWLTVWMADKLAVELLGLTLWELWPEDLL